MFIIIKYPNIAFKIAPTILWHKSNIPNFEKLSYFPILFYPPTATIKVFTFLQSTFYKLKPNIFLITKTKTNEKKSIYEIKH